MGPSMHWGLLSKWVKLKHKSVSEFSQEEEEEDFT